MRVLFVDGSAGLSGDMLLGALVDIGFPAGELEKTVAALRQPVSVTTSRGVRGGIAGTAVRVDAPGDRGHRHLADFRRTLAGSDLPAGIRERAGELLERIFAAEAEIHDSTAERVHLHELGSLDTLVDIVGAVAGLAYLRVDRVVGSEVNLGSGFVKAEHGILAVPAPATALLLRGVPTFADGSGFERTTPTGAVLTGLVDAFEGWPAMTPKRVGYGLGTADPREGRPNALRLVLGEASGSAPGSGRILVIEATVDDLHPELAPHIVERLLAAGAKDAFFAPVHMKKGRPGLHFTALAGESGREAVIAVLFAESSTLGVRIRTSERQVLERRIVSVATRWGPAAVKVGFLDGAATQVAPEFEDCRRIAERSGVPLKQVYHEVLAAAQSLAGESVGPMERRRPRRPAPHLRSLRPHGAPASSPACAAPPRSGPMERRRPRRPAPHPRSLRQSSRDFDAPAPE